MAQQMTLAALAAQMQQMQNALNALMNAQAQQPSVANTRGRKAKTQPKAEQPTQPAPQPKAEKKHKNPNAKVFQKGQSNNPAWKLFLSEKSHAKQVGKKFPTWTEWRAKNINITYAQVDARFKKLFK